MEDWLEAATQILVDDGIDALKISRLSARLGVTKGSFYWHFPTREALLKAALERWELVRMVHEAIARLDRLYDQPLPYMMWLNQRPTDGGAWPDAWLNIEIVSPWRRAGTARFIAAAEVASNEYFNPVIPEMVAEQLRALG